MKTHDDLIYAPIASGGLGPSTAIGRLKFALYPTNSAKTSYKIIIDGASVAIYYLELKSTAYHKLYAIDPTVVRGGGTIGWNSPGELRERFTEFLRRYQIDYDSVSHLIPTS